MIGAVEDVEEAELHEPERGLIPLRVEAHEPGVALIFERAHGPARRQEPERRHDVQAEAAERRVDGEARPLGPDRVVEQHVEHALIPVERGVVGQSRSGHERQRIVIVCKRAIALQ